MSHHHGPEDPPIPHPEHYELSYAAARPSRLRRLLRFIDRHPGWIASAAVLAIAAVPAYVVATDSPATAAASYAATHPAVKPGVPVPQATVAGDGMWLVGRQIEPGVYQSNAGASCYWERLSGLGGGYEDLIDNGGFRKGPQLVEVLGSDYAFTSQGCSKWVRIR